MRLRTVEIEGFRSFRRAERVDLTGLNFTAVVGKNHQGKSTLFHAVEFALFGQSPGTRVVDAITRGEDRAQVSIEFDLGDGTYRVTRTRTQNRHEVMISVSDPDKESGWREISEKNPMQADPMLIELLGMDATTARNTWLIRQGEFGNFCEMDPAPRREVLAAAFGLDVFTELAKQAEKNKKESQSLLEKATWDLDNLQNRARGLESGGSFEDISDDDLEAEATTAEEKAEKIGTELAGLEDPELESRVHQAKDALDTFVSGAEQQERRYASDKSRIERDLAEAKDAIEKVHKRQEQASEAVWEVDDHEEALQAAQKAVQEAEASISALRERMSAEQSQQSSLTTERDAVRTRATEINQQVERLRVSAEKGEGKCWTCGQDLSEEHVHELVDTQEKAKADLKKDYDEKNASVSDIESQIASMRNEVSELETALRQARQQENDAQQALTRVKDLAASVDDLDAEVDKAEERIKALTAELSDLGEPPTRDEAKEKSLREAHDKAVKALEAVQGKADHKDTLTQQRSEARSRARALWQEKSRRESVREESEALVEPTKEAEERVAKHTKDADTYEVLQDSFRPSGIPAMILAGVVEEVNEEANDILGAMGSDLGVYVSTQQESKKGSVAEKVKVYAVTAEGQADYFTLSGQERFFLAFSLRMALARCVARRTGTPIQTIVMDEGWGALDEQSKRSVQEALSRISNEFSIFTVTHIEDVQDAFNTVIRVDSGSGTSRTEITHR